MMQNVCGRASVSQPQVVRFLTDWEVLRRLAAQSVLGVCGGRTPSVPFGCSSHDRHGTHAAL